MNAIPPDTRHPEANGLVDGLLAEGGGSSVSEFDVARLRQGVRCRIDGERVRRAPTSLLGAAAAVVAACAVGLVMMTGGTGGPGASAETAAASFSRTADGQMRIVFADGRPVHRIRKQVLAAGRPAGAERFAMVKTVRGREYVDKNGQPRPGTAVMYTVE